MAPKQPRLAIGDTDMPPGFVPEIVISSSSSKLILQAPPGIIRWTQDGDTCSVDYTWLVIPQGGSPGGGGLGSAGCPWANGVKLVLHRCKIAAWRDQGSRWWPGTGWRTGSGSGCWRGCSRRCWCTGSLPLATGEQPRTRPLLGKLAPGDLLAADRNFLSHGLLADVLAAGVHVLWRAKSDVDLPVLEGQAAGAYASRWQLETCFDELETSVRGGAAVVLRSKSPPMIRQEIYAMLCCYQAIRTLISHAADDAGIDPARISFTRARDAIRSRISDSGCFPPDGLAESAEDLAFEITCQRNLVPRRPGRRYERKTKRPGGRYKTRKPGETTRLTPLTRVVFWLMPIPVLT